MFPEFWGLEVHNQGASQIGSTWGFSLGSINGWFFAVCSHGFLLSVCVEGWGGEREVGWGGERESE